MKLLALLSVFFLISLPAFSQEEENDTQDMVHNQLTAMLKCDSSGAASAKMGLGLARFMMIGPEVSSEKAAAIGARIDESFAMLEKSKTCEDYKKTYAKVSEVLLKDANFDIEAELKKPEETKMLQDVAHAIVTQSKK
jgi:hypothetical protein